MFGQATLQIPRSGNIGPSTTRGLSDKLAMTIGRTTAMTLSDEDGCVIATMSNGDIRIIGHDTTSGKIVIGHLLRDTLVTLV